MLVGQRSVGCRRSYCGNRVGAVSAVVSVGKSRTDTPSRWTSIRRIAPLPLGTCRIGANQDIDVEARSRWGRIRKSQSLLTDEEVSLISLLRCGGTLDRPWLRDRQGPPGVAHRPRTCERCAANQRLLEGAPGFSAYRDIATDHEGTGHPARVGEPGPGSSSLLCTWVCVKPRLAPAAVRGFRLELVSEQNPIHFSYRPLGPRRSYDHGSRCGSEDLLVAMAAYEAACRHWPGETITCVRQELSRNRKEDLA